jgi:outer membrane protein OmpA-like peptidoglycan-associated protein
MTPLEQMRQLMQISANGVSTTLRTVGHVVNGARRPDFYRLLNPKERLLVTSVFGNTLPPWNQIGIGNGLGLDGAPWTGPGDADFSLTPDVRYLINLGDVATRDLTSRDETAPILGADYDPICELFVHEMTHVWQYFHGFSVAWSSAWAHTGGSYDFTAGDSWDSYNKEQQSEIVRVWHSRNNDPDDVLYPYIYQVVQSGGVKQYRDMNLAELRLSMMKITDVHGPVQLSAQEEEIAIQLPGDALFDTNRDNLKPEAIRVLSINAAPITAYRGHAVLVQGHTDNTGNPAYNMDLSMRRAKAVAKWLVSNNYVDSSKVDIDGRGQSQPVDTNNTAAGRAKNRRVSIIILKR